MNFDYCPVNYPGWVGALSPWDRTALSVFGLNRMLAPLKMPLTRQGEPVFAYWDDERTGRFSKRKGTESFSIFGIERYRWEDGSIIFRDMLGVELTVTPPTITTPIEVFLPSKSGTLARVEDVPTTFEGTNVDLVDIPKGSPVAKDPDTNGGIFLASAADSSRPPCGLATEDIAVGLTGVVLLEGTVELSDWTTQTGGSALNPNSIYYLGTTAGQLAPPPIPTGSGQIVAEVGRAVGYQTLYIQPRVIGRRA